LPGAGWPAPRGWPPLVGLAARRRVDVVHAWDFSRAVCGGGRTLARVPALESLRQAIPDDFAAWHEVAGPDGAGAPGGELQAGWRGRSRGRRWKASAARWCRTGSRGSRSFRGRSGRGGEPPGPWAGDVVVMAVGRLDENKTAPPVEAFGRIRGGFPFGMLVFLGMDPFVATARAASRGPRDVGVGPDFPVSFRGRVPDGGRDVRRAERRWTEGLPNVVMEGVGRRCSGRARTPAELREVVEDGLSVGSWSSRETSRPSRPPRDPTSRRRSGPRWAGRGGARSRELLRRQDGSPVRPDYRDWPDIHVAESSARWDQALVLCLARPAPWLAHRGRTTRLSSPGDGLPLGFRRARDPRPEPHGTSADALGGRRVVDRVQRRDLNYVELRPSWSEGETSPRPLGHRGPPGSVAARGAGRLSRLNGMSPSPTSRSDPAVPPGPRPARRQALYLWRRGRDLRFASELEGLLPSGPGSP